MSADQRPRHARPRGDDPSGRAVLGVGVLGAGPVTQAIHLPTLARLTDRFAVRHVMDVDGAVAAATAARVGAAHSGTLEELLADEDVDVVAVCSPPQFHADQVIAALRAGKRAVLCEKPFATSRAEAEQIAAVSVETGVPVLVGAMHTFDPGWTAARRAWGDLPARAHTVRSSIVLPPNPRFEDFATEVHDRAPFPTGRALDPAARAGLLSAGVLGLAIHDLPLVREFLPRGARVRVHDADLLSPFGYGITLSAGDRHAVLVAAMHGHWAPRWELDVIADDQALHVEFTPSYVHAGSAVATLTAADGSSRTFGPYDRNGYEVEWRTLHDLAHGDAGAAPSLTTLIDDLVLAVDIAEAAAAAVLPPEAAA
ncbi:Gfo/Idh/MocA family protein [Kineococcus sp. TBRC 1896]|uniref:Gfo/Idh/MocA family protein n=1 Tax=Kineococcus mangrovi TaxID=1660183 RepID=A0ABV4I3Z1_9ACTN